MQILPFQSLSWLLHTSCTPTQYMDGGRFSECGPEVAEKAVEVEVVSPSFSEESFSAAQLGKYPMLLLVLYHRALRAELAELYRAAEALVETVVVADRLGMLVELKERVDFLKIAYKYHCAAEDEVIFLALDRHVENIASAYSLEHRSIDDLIDSIVRLFDAVMDGGDIKSKLLLELMFCIGTLQTIVCKHMVKEEKQVFPLLRKLFSQEEQASLMWNFLCSVPFVFLQELLPWMISYLSLEEQHQIASCVKDIVPKNKLLQEVIVSCFKNIDQSMCNEMEVRARVPLRRGKIRNILQIHASDSISEDSSQPKKECYDKYIHCSPIDAVHLWHLAIGKDLETSLEELNQLQGSQNVSNLSSIILHLKFLADVLSFYGHSLDQLVIPLLKELDESCHISVMAQLPYRRQLENMQRALQYNAKNDVTKLCHEVKSLLMVISKFFTFQELKVFETIRNKCSHNMQRELLFASTQVLPLGLLRCVITWFSPHLSDKNSMSIVAMLNQGSFRYQDHFTSLLREWFLVAYSNETHINKFREFLQDAYVRRSFLWSKKVEEHNECIKLASYCKEPQVRLGDAEFSVQTRKSLPCSSSSIISNISKVDLPYSREINLRILFPMTMNRPIFSQLSSGKNDHSSDVSRSRPIDLIFFFHKALEKDLNDLVECSNQLAENVRFLKDFQKRFHLIKHLYQIHSNAEDEIAFPALEEKGKVQNISHSYAIDHKLEVEHFNNISMILEKMSELQVSSHTSDSRMVHGTHHQLTTKLQDMCRSMHKILSDHIHHEQIELWSLFRESFSTEEQEKVIGNMIGRIRAEILQVMIPWLLFSLKPEEKHAAMSIWRQVTKKTMFDEWLGEWWEVDKTVKLIEPDACPSKTIDPFEIISTYLSRDICKDPQGKIHSEKDIKCHQDKSSIETSEASKETREDYTANIVKGDKYWEDSSKCIKLINDVNLGNNEDSYEARAASSVQVSSESSYRMHLGAISQEELEAAIRRVSRDSSLDSQQKSHIIQNLMMSRWIVANQKTDLDIGDSPDTEEVPGRSTSYRDPFKQIYGCKHYKRNCKLLASCCNQLYTCIRCHDEMTDHLVDRKAIIKMMCMKCLTIQPIGPTCTTPSCNNLSMAKYYCKICKIYDDEREIYHCPYCNLCRVGKGLGVDYFHCMNCNACMSRSLSVHICREKCFEGNCPICHEYIFTSSMPVKALPCGHLMHSACFQDYTCSHYTCPICSKSLGDMRVYFQMLDALLAEETIPDEYASKTQDILCNDCEKRGNAPFHWLYHKCSHCGSYNTRLL